jgi:hypothetical protein
MSKTQKVPVWTYDDPVPTPNCVRQHLTLSVISSNIVITCAVCRQEWAASVPFTIVYEHALRHDLPPPSALPAPKKGKNP